MVAPLHAHAHRSASSRSRRSRGRCCGLLLASARGSALARIPAALLLVSALHAGAWRSSSCCSAVVHARRSGAARQRRAAVARMVGRGALAPQVFGWRQPFRSAQRARPTATGHAAAAASCWCMASSAIAASGTLAGAAAGARRALRRGRPRAGVRLDRRLRADRLTSARAAARAATGLRAGDRRAQHGRARGARLVGRRRRRARAPRDHDRHAASRHLAGALRARRATRGRCGSASDWLQAPGGRRAGHAAALHLLLQPLRQHRVPAAQRLLPGADNRHLEATGHVALAHHPRW